MEHVAFQILLKMSRYLEETSKFSGEAEIFVLPGALYIQPLNDHRQVTKYGGVHQG